MVSAEKMHAIENCFRTTRIFLSSSNSDKCPAAGSFMQHKNRDEEAGARLELELLKVRSTFKSYVLFEG